MRSSIGLAARHLVRTTSRAGSISRVRSVSASIDSNVKSATPMPAAPRLVRGRGDRRGRGEAAARHQVPLRMTMPSACARSTGESCRRRESRCRVSSATRRGSGLGGASPEEHEWSGVDKGTEPFKQDFSTWESLRKDVDSALDRYEASVIAKAARKGFEERLSAGGSDRVPDDYRRLIARYYESLAKKK